MRIMFVCHGNICRSPMAEFVMKKLVQEHGLENKIQISSSAVSTEEIGNPVYPPARRELARHGISCEGKQAVQLKKADYEKYDLFLLMDNSNLFYICRIFPDDPEQKIYKLLEYAGGSGDVADPWYTGDFEKAYQDIYHGCTAALDKIQEEYFS